MATQAERRPSRIDRTGAPVAPGRPLLVFFSAPRSGRAKQVEGFLAQVLQRRRNHETFRIVPVDAAARPDLVARFRVTTMPALLVVEDKTVKGRLEAPRGCAEIEALLRPWLR